MNRRYTLAALILGCSLWGLSVPLSKLALEWLSPTQLTVGRFLVAGLGLAFVGRRGLRGALHWRVALPGVCGFGVAIELQNVGITHTSVSHAAVLMGLTPALVALVGLLVGHGRASTREWLSYGAAAAGIFLVAGRGGGGASLGGDLLVLGSVLASAIFISGQPRVLAGRDPAAVTAVQFLSAGFAALPLCLGHPLAAPAASTPVVAFLALALVGTLLPFWLFASAQARVPARLAGAFVNLEPVVGAAIGWIAFADPFSVFGLLGAFAVVGAIALAAIDTTPAVFARWRPAGRDQWTNPLATP